MRAIFLFLVLSAGSICFGQTRLYENPQFDQIAREHDVIAIVPFQTSINLRPKQLRQLTPEEVDQMEESEGKDLQAALYSWFLKRQQRGKLTVAVQSIAETNTILLREGIGVDSYDEYTPSDIAQLMGVDAVVMGTLDTDKPMSEEAVLTIGVLSGFWGTTNRAVVNLFIYNAEDGGVLVNYHKAVQGSSGSSTEELVNRLMRKASRRIAYTK